MKHLSKALFAVAMVSFGVFSCQKTITTPNAENELTITSAEMITEEECPPGPYLVDFVSKTYIGNEEWEWKWFIKKNPDWPVSVQDLSHVDLLFPPCVNAEEELVSVAYSNDNLTWHSVSTNMVIDPSINANPNCPEIENPPTIKLEITGEGGYYKIVINKNYAIGYGMPLIYKSGSNTCTGYLCYVGISCAPPPPPPGEEPVGCSFSQGFWFVKPYGEANAWPGGSLTMGGKVYTPEEARSLWWINGNVELKRAFTQAGTIKLSLASGYLTNGAAVAGYVANIDGVLSGLPKLTPANLAAVNKGLAAPIRKNLGQWAGAIGDWIDANHCEKPEVPY